MLSFFAYAIIFASANRMRGSKLFGLGGTASLGVSSIVAKEIK